VIRHELFHAMLCSKRPETCTDEALKNVDTVALHEGLADFFTYSLAPDMAFGEGFYRDQPWIRTYRTSLCYSLVSGAHEKGNAIVSRLVEEGKVFFEIPSILAERAFTPASLFDDPSEGCFASSGAPVIDVAALNHPASRLNRYYIEQEGALELQVVPNAEARRLYPEMETRWTLASNDSGDWEGSKSNAAAFRVSAVLSPDMAFPLHFSIFPPEDASIDPVEKWVAGFYSRGERIGQKAFYFTRKKHP
jgi:hypothetical protein